MIIKIIMVMLSGTPSWPSVSSSPPPRSTTPSLRWRSMRWRHTLFLSLSASLSSWPSPWSALLSRLISKRSPAFSRSQLLRLRLFLIAGHDRRCSPEGPDGVQVKCKLTQTRGELAHHHKQFRPRVQKQPTTTATDPHFTTTHQASCNIPNGWEQTSAVWQMLTKSPADSLFSKFKSVRSRSGGCASRSIMITVTELQTISAPKMSHPCPFWAWIICPLLVDCPLRGTNLFLAHFCVQNHRTRWGRCALTGRIFEPKKTDKGRIWAGRQVTRWRIWRLWFWYTTQDYK